MLSFYPILPMWLILLLLIASAGVVFRAYRHRNPAIQPWRHITLLALRLMALLLIIFMLLCPGRMTEEKNVENSHIVFLLDRSASMETRDLPARQSRLEQATEFLTTSGFKRLRDYPQVIYSFNNQSERHDDPLTSAPLKAEGGTDFKQVVDRVDKDIGLNRVSAIVLLSDGLDYSDFKGSEITVPIMSVQIGTDMTAVKDLGIEPFKYPRKVSEGEELVLEIPVMMRGYSREKQVKFEVRVDGGLIHSSMLKLSSGRPHTEKTRVVLEKTGVRIIRVNCEHFPDEVTELNNQRELALEVVEAKDEVALYFPLLNNSFRPLLREFLKEKEALFSAVYKVADNSYRLRGHKINPVFSNGLPPRADQIESVTCLILGSHNGELLSAAESLMLEQYVRKGGTLVCLAGADSFGRLPSGSPLRRLLPVVTLDNSFRAGTFKVVPEATSDDAFTDQIREIIAANDDSVEFSLSGINNVKDLKAGAQVLLWAVDEGRQPLIVWHSYGRGKVVAMLSNSFHQWGAPEKRDQNFSRLWRQLVAFSKNSDEDSDLLKVALSKTELAVGEVATLTAIARNPAAGDDVDGALTVKADLFPVESQTPISSITLEKKSDCFMADLNAPKPGRYVLRVSSHAGRAALRIRYKFLVVGDVLRESARVRSERENFRAVSSEKHIFDFGEAERLENNLLEALRKNIIRREKFMIFENPAFFIAVVMLLMCEWFLRRRFNLF